MLAALAAFLLARAVARPIERVAQASLALAAGERPGPLAPEGPTEVAALAEAFNHMSDDLDRARDAERSFLLSVSHELKTPLAAIRGHGEALIDGVMPSRAGGGVILRESKRLERLVRDLLDLARLNPALFSRPSPARSTSPSSPTRRSSGTSRVARASASSSPPRRTAPAPAVADPDRTLQVLSNLIENALRSPRAAAPSPSRAEPAMLTVADTGPGLAAGGRCRAPSSASTSTAATRSESRAVGTGLGLAIVQELTEAMGGSVGVESKPGAGTTFTVSLPRDEGPTPAGRRAPRPRALRA